MSQLDLAMLAGTSQRHLSFVESGRAQPSREMILRLVQLLNVPLRARNEILLAAGFAPVYPERPLASAEMTLANQLLTRLLGHHEPYPALILDGGWNVVMKNRATSWLIAKCISEEALRRFTIRGKLNFLRLMCDGDGLRKHIRSWDSTGPALFARLRKEAAAFPGSPSSTLLREMLDGGVLPAFDASSEIPLEPVIPLAIMVDGNCLRLFNTLTTFGTPQDVTLQELRIEMSFPADEATDRILRSVDLAIQPSVLPGGL